MRKQKFAGWALAAALTATALPALAQQDDIPILRPKSQTTKPAISTLLVTCDLACNWKLDGEAKGRIDAGASAKVKVELGQHIVSAATEDGIDKLEKEIEIMPPGQTVIHVALQQVRDARLKAEQQAKDKADREARDNAAREQAAREAQEKAARDQQETVQMLRELATPTWTDQATGLTWTKKDNGAGVTWQQATDYCHNLQLAGHGDWRLATIDEFQGICAGGHNVKAGLQSSGWWYWSNSKGGNASGDYWGFTFAGSCGAIGPFGPSGASVLRALCVRRDAQDARELATVTWTDPATGLMWAKKDNGSDVNWQQATDYCRNLQLAGHVDWRLPTIDELEGIFDRNAYEAVPGANDFGQGYHVKGNLQLSGWQWSSSSGNASAQASRNTFTGERHSFRHRDAKALRALCVRRSGE